MREEEVLDLQLVPVRGAHIVLRADTAVVQWTSLGSAGYPRCWHLNSGYF